MTKEERKLVKEMTRLWYSQMESGVRDWVNIFRNVGINTTCSCHHKGYIQCESLDPTTEITTIRNVFMELEIKDYVILFFGEEKAGLYHQYIQIQSSVFLENKK